MEMGGEGDATNAQQHGDDDDRVPKVAAAVAQIILFVEGVLRRPPPSEL